MSVMKLLAIETSSATGSVALGIGADISERAVSTPREQTESVLGFVDELLAEAGIGLGDLDALLFGRGPGSFTGLRVAAAVMQGLSLASGVPIVPLSSLAALAERGLGATGEAGLAALCCIDARMGEVYSGSFGRIGGSLCATSGERIGRAGDIIVPEGPFVALGDGFGVFAEELEAVIGRAVRVEPDSVPRARDLLALGAGEVEAGQFVPIDAALPVYLRGANAWKRAP